MQRFYVKCNKRGKPVKECTSICKKKQLKHFGKTNPHGISNNVCVQWSKKKWWAKTMG